MRRVVDEEAGFTLVELMISIALLGVIIGPIFSSFLIGFLEADSTRERIADSTSAQLTTAFLLADIESSREVLMTGDACLPDWFDDATDTVHLQLRWWSPEIPTAARTAEPDNTAAYIERDDGDPQHELYRSFCGPSGDPEDLLLIQSLRPLTDADAFVVSCDVPDPTDTDDCSDTTPDVVNVAITAENTDPSEKSSYAPLSFEIEAMRRVSDEATP